MAWRNKGGRENWVARVEGCRGVMRGKGEEGWAEGGRGR